MLHQPGHVIGDTMSKTRFMIIAIAWMLNPLLFTFLFPMKSGTPTPPPPVQGYHLVFSDDFRAIDLSPDGAGAHTWYEGVWYSAHHAPLENIEANPFGLTLTWTRGQAQP